MQAKHLLAATSFILALTSFAQAKVVVYRGYFRGDADLSQKADVGAVAAFLVMDYDTKEVATFTYNPARKTYQGGGAAVIHITSTQLSQGRTATLISYSYSNATDDSHYADRATLLRGSNVSLRLATSPTAVFQNLPGSLKGKAISADANGASGTFFTEDYNVSVDPVRTLKENNVQHPIAKTIEGLSNEFDARGYHHQ